MEPTSGPVMSPASGPDTSGPSPDAATEGPPAEVVRKWCVAKSNVSDVALQKNIDYVCSSEVDCKPIQKDGPCFEPNTVKSHAAFVMNAYYQENGAVDINCDFNGTGVVTAADPSYKTCTYLSKVTDKKSPAKSPANSPAKSVTGSSSRMEYGSKVALFSLIIGCGVLFNI